MYVQTSSIFFMAVSALLSIGVPIGLLIFFRKKFKSRMIPALVGAAAFIVFALILEQILHSLVLKPDANGAIALASQPFLYMLYGCFAAGIFEETARYLSFKLMKKKYSDFPTALSYGVGHGGIEAIVIAGLSMISAMVMSFMVNSGSLAILTSQLPAGTLAQLQAQIDSLAVTPSYMFLISGVERLAAICIHISLSVIVFYSVADKGKWWLFPLAILLHAVVNAPAALSQVGVITNIWLIEGYVIVCALLLALLAAFLHKRESKNAQGDH